MINHSNIFITIMPEYIYLLQEREFIKTLENIYKIGKSKQENLKRIQNYPNGTELIIQSECDDCDIVEKELIKIFKEKFIQRTDIGTEYFKGDKYKMRKIISDYINNEQEIEEIDVEQEVDVEEEVYIEEEEEEYFNKGIQIKFPNYKDDESFGGKQKLIKVIIDKREIQNNYNLSVYYIDNDKCLEYEKRFISTEHESWYYNKLIKKKIIENNTIYNLNDKKFQKMLNHNKNKFKIHSEYNSYFKKKYDNYKNKNYSSIIDIILENCILNDEIYCDSCSPKCCNKYAINTKFNIEEYGNSCDSCYSNNNTISIINIDNILYDYVLLRKYTPYYISYTNNEYIIYNRQYKIIDGNDIDTKLVEGSYDYEYLYNDSSNPIRPTHKKSRMIELLNDMISNYKRITQNKTCIHKISEYTKFILNN